MKRNILLLLLAISLGFNIFFLAGYLKAKHDAKLRKTLAGRAQLVAKKADLSHYEKQRLVSLLRKTLQVKKELLQAKRRIAHLFKTQMQREHPNIVELKKAIKEYQSHKKKLLRNLRQNWREFLLSLPPKKRRKLRAILHRNHFLHKFLFIGGDVFTPSSRITGK